MGIEAIAIVHYDEHGVETFHICGDARFRLFVVDDRAPNDRVYEMTDRCKADDIKKLMRDDPIGHRNDSRHAAIEARILEAATGAPRLRPVSQEK